jgi:hypothetical protein
MWRPYPAAAARRPTLVRLQGSCWERAQQPDQAAQLGVLQISSISSIQTPLQVEMPQIHKKYWRKPATNNQQNPF